MGGRSRRGPRPAGPAPRGPALSRRWVAVLLLLAAVVAGLRGVHLLQEPAQATAFVTEQVVVVGVTGRPALTDPDRAVLEGHLDDAQVGAVNVRPRYVGD